MQSSNDSTFTFEIAYAELEGILSELNKTDTPLEKSMELYEKANKLIMTCTEKLTQAEQRIEMLVKNSEGKTTLKDFNTNL